MPFRMIFPVRGSLMKTHGIRKRSVEQPVVGSCTLFNNFSYLHDLGSIQHRKIRQMFERQNHSLEWPYGPERHENNKPFVLKYHASAQGFFRLGILAEQAFVLRFQVIA